MKIHAIYDKQGRIIAANIPPQYPTNPFEIRAASHGPIIHRPTAAGSEEHMEGIFDMPDELTMLNPVELTHMMENVKVDLKAKTLSIVRK